MGKVLTFSDPLQDDILMFLGMRLPNDDEKIAPG